MENEILKYTNEKALEEARERKTQKLCYVDAKTGEYIHMTCKLKPTVNAKTLKSFYNTIYKARIDGSYSRDKKIAEFKSSGDFISAFKEILTQDNIDLGQLNACIYRTDEEVSEQAALLTTTFFEFFDYKESSRLTSEEQIILNRKFYCGEFADQTAELNRATANGVTFAYIGCTPSDIAKRSTHEVSAINNSSVNAGKEHQASIVKIKDVSKKAI